MDDQELPGMPEPPAPPAVEDTPPDASRTRAPRTRSRSGKRKPAATPADKPPRTRTPRPPRPRVSASQRAEVYGRKMLPLYAMLGMGSQLFPGVGADGAQILTQYAPLMAKSWGPLAADNEAVAALVDRLTESSALMGLVMSHVAVAGAVLAAKGKAPAQLGMLAPLFAAMSENPDALAALLQQDSGAPTQDGAPVPSPPRVGAEPVSA